MKRFAVLYLALIPCGCGPATGDIEGRVLFKGEPMVAGTVTIVSEQGMHPAVINAGTYAVKGVVVGDAKILVVGPDQLPHPDWPQDAEPHVRRVDRGKVLAAPAASPEGQRQPLNYTYRTLETTPLTFTVKPGKNKHDINVE